MSKKHDLSKELGEFRELPQAFESLLMATCDNNGLPEASYAPYVEEMGDYYIYISDLAAHTGNLLANPQCSILFIQNEDEARNLFARQRVTLQCEATEIARGSEQFQNIMTKFGERFGNLMDMLSDYTDFHLFRLHPKLGNYVAGFAQAYTITGEHLDSIRLRDEKGHQREKRA